LARELSATSQEMIRHFYRYDFELYDRMLELFQRRLDRVQLKGDFADYKSACAAEYKERLLDQQPMSEGCQL
jgi:predicted translin family RNA/ssDNA-binding protein